MKYYININGKEYKVKDTKTFSFKDYHQMMELLEIDDVVIQYKELLKFFTKIPHDIIEQIKNPLEVNFKQILEEGYIASNNIIKKFNDNDIINFDEITVSRFIDITYFLNSDLDDKMERVIALLFANDELTNYESLVEKIKKDMKVGDGILLFNFISKWVHGFYKTYSGLFEEVDNDDTNDDDINDEEIKSEGWGMMSFVYYLANDNFLNVDEILSKKLIQMMNYLSWRKEQTDREIAAQKAAQNKNKY